MITRDQIVSEARTWVGTPFHHQARVKGAGVDCVGLAIGVANTLGLVVKDMRAYSRVPLNGMFLKAVTEQTESIAFEDVLPGDMLLFKFNHVEAQHLAIITQINPIHIVHAYSHVAKCVEHELDQTWRARLVCACRFKELSCQLN